MFPGRDQQVLKDTGSLVVEPEERHHLDDLEPTLTPNPDPTTLRSPSASEGETMCRKANPPSVLPLGGCARAVGTAGMCTDVSRRDVRLVYVFCSSAVSSIILNVYVSVCVFPQPCLPPRPRDVCA